MKKNFDVVFAILMGIFLSFLLIILSSLILVYDQDFYKEEFSKHNIYDKFDNADNISNNMIGYFRNSNNLMNIYSREEKIHLADVKNIINFLEKFFYVGIILFFVICFFLMYKNYKYLHWIFISGTISVIFIIMALYILYILSFDFLFVNFHLVLFDNSYWMLENNSLLVNIFTEGFFADALKRILLTSFFISMFSLGLGFGIKRSKIWNGKN